MVMRTRRITSVTRIVVVLTACDQVLLFLSVLFKGTEFRLEESFHP